MKYRVSANSHGWVIQKQVTNKGVPKWVGDKWLSSAVGLGKFLIDLKARCYVTQGEGVIEAITKAHKEVVKMLETKTVEFSLVFKSTGDEEEEEKPRRRRRKSGKES